MAWPPGPVFRSLLGTLATAYVLAVGITLLLSGGVGMNVPLGSLQAILWRVGLVMTLLWVELHRQSTRVFLVNLGVSRAATMRSLFLVYVILEGFLLSAAYWGART